MPRMRQKATARKRSQIAVLYNLYACLSLSILTCERRMKERKKNNREEITPTCHPLGQASLLSSLTRHVSREHVTPENELLFSYSARLLLFSLPSTRHSSFHLIDGRAKAIGPCSSYSNYEKLLPLVLLIKNKRLHDFVNSVTEYLRTLLLFFTGFFMVAASGDIVHVIPRLDLLYIFLPIPWKTNNKFTRICIPFLITQNEWSQFYWSQLSFEISETYPSDSRHLGIQAIFFQSTVAFPLSWRLMRSLLMVDCRATSHLPLLFAAKRKNSGDGCGGKRN